MFVFKSSEGKNAKKIIVDRSKKVKKAFKKKGFSEDVRATDLRGNYSLDGVSFDGDAVVIAGEKPDFKKNNDKESPPRKRKE